MKPSKTNKGAKPGANSAQKIFNTDGGKTKSNAIQVPGITLPKGGGAIKSMDEKFSVNAVNGTAGFSVPLPFSPSRNGAPALSLSYSSGNGNGVFGLGWDVGLPTIRRKTDKELPQYQDGIDSDTFMMAEAEDLVPEFQKEVDGSFSLDEQGDYIIRRAESTDGLHTIRYYRPRVEGAFARIERWTEKFTGIIRWRVISSENVTTLFGWSSQSVISDPQETTKIFEWFPELIFDDKGNCTHYIYKAENAEGFDRSLLHNRNRMVNGQLMYTNLYLEKVLHGNKTPYKNFGDEYPLQGDYMFSTVFDYGEYDTNSPYEKINNWAFRQDAFSNYKAGFEIRTTRLCRRVLLFHHFTGENEYEGLVRSADFGYDTSAERDFTFLQSVTAWGYVKKTDGNYSSKKLPALEFGYQPHTWSKEVKTIDAEDLVHAPAGLSAGYQFTDLYNEGLSGMLTEQANGWYYKHNLGNGKFSRAALVTPKPSLNGLGKNLELADLDADGGKQVVSYERGLGGYFELDDNNEWNLFRQFRQLPAINFEDPNLRMIDLNGDGRADIMIAEDHVFTWYASEGRDGFTRAQQTIKARDEEDGPFIIFSEEEQTVFLADMSGNGMNDIVRIRNGEVCYWPNLGYGKFGAKVAMDNAPVFDHPELFNTDYLHLADIDGSGTADIIYLGKNKFTCWQNLSGNSFSTTTFEIDEFPEMHDQSSVTVTDLLGNGVSCIVWSDNLLKNSGTSIRYIDLMSSKKPHLLIDYKNNLGKEMSVEYAPSTQFYLQDRLAGRPWVTKLHYPVHCISKTESRDRITGHRFVSSYTYHHGYFDHAEKEFRGFGMVEQIDTEHFEHWVKAGATNIVDAELHQEPVVSRSWHHTGAFIGREKILDQFTHEYWHAEMNRQGFAVINKELALPDARIIAAPGIPATVLQNLSAVEWQEALRACKGMQLRSELFTHDAPATGATQEQLAKQLTPYLVSQQNCEIQLLQPKGKNKYAVFLVKESEEIKYAYERNTEDPRIIHTLNTRIDEYGNALEIAVVVYPRTITDNSLPAATRQHQAETSILYSQKQYTNDVIGDHTYRLRHVSEEKAYEVKGVAKNAFYYSLDDFDNVLNNAVEIGYHQHDLVPAPGISQKRLTEQARTIFYRNDLTGTLPLHQQESHAIIFESYQLAYTPELLQDIFGNRVNDALLTEGKFSHSEGDDNWWIRSGTTQYIAGAETVTDAENRFFVPLAVTDPWGAITRLKYYSNYFLFVHETEDAMSNKAFVDEFNFRTLSPQRMRDINNNISASICDELGIVKVSAVMGKGNEGDDVTGFTEATDINESALISNFLSAPDSTQLMTMAKTLLGSASSRFVYDYDTYVNTGKPAVTASIIREEHFQVNNDSPVQIDFEYADGTGQVVMKKEQAEPGIAKQVIVQNDNTIQIVEVDTAAVNPPQVRWLGNGRKVLNNKGNPVKQYEPYFSVTHQYEDLKELVETGVTPIIYYDAMSRPVRTDLPNGSFTKQIFDCWKQLVFDANDTILESSWYLNRVNRLIDTELLSEGKDPVKEAATANQSAMHANTPAQLHLDNMGRPVLSVSHNKNVLTNADEFILTTVEVDAEGNLRKITDARGNNSMRYKYDMLGNMAYQHSMDAGQRWMLTDISQKSLATWDERNHQFRYFYDILHRPTHSRVTGGDGDIPLDHIFDRAFYGEDLLLPGRSNEAALQADNLLGQPTKVYDTGGVTETPAYDFKEHAPLVSRRLFSRYKEVANWTDNNLENDLEQQAFVTITEIDAIERVKRYTFPDGSVSTLSYNEAGVLEAQTVTHVDPAITTDYIKDIDYNEKGQRSKIIYGNDIVTRMYYDKKTFRLIRLESRRQNNELLQDLYYTYDPVGNITHLEDKTIPLVFFNNQKITGVSEYRYDARYQLVSATGRENDAALSFANQDNWNDAAFMRSHNTGDAMAMRNYQQQYSYDVVGNIVQMRQVAAGNSWTRDYIYESNTNRLVSTQVGTDIFQYPHHMQHGYITGLPHLNDMQWNFKEELIKTVTQNRTDGGTAETTWYQYDGNGQRVRKITENQAEAGQTPSRKEERIYIGPYELYKKYSGPDAGLERISISLMDEEHRFVMIETRNEVDDGTEKHLVRYQLHNHLGSATLELDQDNRVVSYEEYHPFGTTAYQAKNAAINAVAKRYRFSGMERDDETGLNYHSARYYLPWLGRWLNCDPIGIEGGLNFYEYSCNNPVSLVDTTGLNPNAPPQLQAGKDWEKEMLDKVGKKVPLVRQVRVAAVINGEKVVSILDGLVFQGGKWAIIETKLNPDTKLRAQQKKIKEWLAAGNSVEIHAVDDKLKELQKTFGKGNKTKIALDKDKYIIAHQGNAGEVLDKLKAKPKNLTAIINSKGKMTLHKQETLNKINQQRLKTPGLTLDQLKERIRAVQKKTWQSKNRPRRGAANVGLVGGIAFVAVIAGGIFYAVKSGVDVKQAIMDAGKNLAIEAATSKIFGFKGAFLVDMAFNLESCNGAADQEHKAVMEFLTKNFPDAVSRSENFLGGVTYSLKPGNEELYKEALDFLKNAPRMEVELPPPVYDPCAGAGNESGASPTGSCN